MSLETAFEVGRLFLPLRQIADAVNPTDRDPFIHLPGLRGYWPMSIVDTTGSAIDHSSASAKLSRTGSPLFNSDGNAYVQLGVGTDYLFNSTSVFNITGTEAWIAPSLRGLTIGGWFWVDSTPGDNSGLVSKHGPSPQYGFSLSWTTANTPQFLVSDNGTSVFYMASSVRLVNTWYFIVGRFIPGSEVAVFVNGEKAALTASIPSSINVSTQDFEVGRQNNDNGRVIEGRARDVFICAAALSDNTLSDLHQASRPS